MKLLENEGLENMLCVKQSSLKIDQIMIGDKFIQL